MINQKNPCNPCNPCQKKVKNISNTLCLCDKFSAAWERQDVRLNGNLFSCCNCFGHHNAPEDAGQTAGHDDSTAASRPEDYRVDSAGPCGLLPVACPRCTLF